MKRKDRIFRLIAVTALGLSVYTLIRYEILLIAFRQATEELKQVGVDLQFADITDRYDDDKGEK